jgi:hypothetical protein
MYTTLLLILFTGVMVVPLFITGPVAAVIFNFITKIRNYFVFLLFWFLLLVTNGIAGLLIITTFGHSWPGPGFFTVLATPISAIASLIILLRLRKKLWHNLINESRWRILYVIGIILIPSFQILVAIISPRFVDSVCRWLYPMGLGC